MHRPGHVLAATHHPSPPRFREDLLLSTRVCFIAHVFTHSRKRQEKEDTAHHKCLLLDSNVGFFVILTLIATCCCVTRIHGTRVDRRYKYMYCAWCCSSTWVDLFSRLTFLLHCLVARLCCTPVFCKDQGYCGFTHDTAKSNADGNEQPGCTDSLGSP